MKPKAFLFALLASVLLVLLIAACSDDKNDSVSDCAFGTPYSVNATVQPTKIAEFNDYPKAISSLSRSVELADIHKLEEAIKVNMSDPFGAGGQLYNYAIRPTCEIIVAEWTGDMRSEEFSQLLIKDFCHERDFIPVTTENGMINIFPEDKRSEPRVVDESARQSPCWLDSSREKGLLDALSKHFMLAQGKNKTIGNFNEGTWPDTKVAYAGEILIDPQDCTFLLNGGSGTYLPKRSLAPTVTAFFARELNNGSQILSGIGPWCPTPSP